MYELNQIALLRDVFVWPYERSCQRYLAIAQTMVEPDPLKIKYREALIQAVQTIVKGLRQPSPAVIAEVAQDHVTDTGQAAFCELLTLALGQAECFSGVSHHVAQVCWRFDRCRHVHFLFGKFHAVATAILGWFAPLPNQHLLHFDNRTDFRHNLFCTNLIRH